MLLSVHLLIGYYRGDDMFYDRIDFIAWRFCTGDAFDATLLTLFIMNPVI
jgi:hypothetical protein